MGPGAHQPRALISQARELHLQAAFAGAGPPGEDLQDHAGAVQHLDLPGLLQIALLYGRQGVVDHHDIDLVLARQVAQLRHLALAEQGGGCGGAQGGDAGIADLQVEGLSQAHSLLQPRRRRAQALPSGAGRMDHQGGLNFRPPVDRSVLWGGTQSSSSAEGS